MKVRLCLKNWVKTCIEQVYMLSKLEIRQFDKNSNIYFLTQQSWRKLNVFLQFIRRAHLKNFNQ